VVLQQTHAGGSSVLAYLGKLPTMPPKDNYILVPQRLLIPCLHHRYISAFLTTPGSINPNHVLYEVAVLDQVSV